MNELLADFEDVLTKTYQDKARGQLRMIMAHNPTTVTKIAKAMNMAPNSLTKFLKGQLVSYCIIMKIDNYIQNISSDEWMSLTEFMAKRAKLDK